MSEVLLQVEMTCEGCANAVRRVLSGRSEVQDININLTEQSVQVKTTLSPNEVLEIIEKTGKKTKLISS